jgi:hypothetical protein
MTEHTFARAVRQEILRQYPDALYVKTNDRTTGGQPDAFVARGGRVIFLEYKVGKRPLSPIQEAMIRRYSAAGLDVRVWVRNRDGTVDELVRWRRDPALLRDLVHALSL